LFAYCEAMNNNNVREKAEIWHVWASDAEFQGKCIPFDNDIRMIYY